MVFPLSAAFAKLETKMEKMFFISVIVSTLFGFYFIWYFILETLVGLLASILIIVPLYIFFSRFADHSDNKNWLKREITLYVIMGVLITHLPAYYLSSARITHSKKLKDSYLINIDTFLLGWAFPKGQLSLYLDNNDWLGPHTGVGQFFNSLLQIFYFLYYLVPYVGIYAICLSKCVKETLFRHKNNGVKSQTHHKNWTNLYFMFAVYNLVYCCIFFVNTLVPASSPRLYIQEQFVHPLNLSGLAAFLNKTCKDNKGANSFPSGHVGETICVAFCLLKIGKKTSGYIFLFASIMIALATLFLRYHYFCDVLAALLIVTASFCVSYFFGYKPTTTEHKVIGSSTELPYVKEVDVV